MQGAAKTRRRLGIVRRIGNQAGQFGIEIVDQVVAQLCQIDAAGAQHRNRVLILQKRQQQVFQRGEFVAAFTGEAQGPLERFLKVTRKHDTYSFSRVH